MIVTLPKAVYLTPASWGDQQHFCTWEQLSEIASELRNNGIEASNYDAEQFILIGDNRRGAPRGWYHQSRYSTADDKTTWSEDCALLTLDLKVLKKASLSEVWTPYRGTAEERAILMRCLARA